MSDARQSAYATVAAAIRYLDAQVYSQPSLQEVASAVGLSEGHLQRLFTEWAGISPKRFLQALTLARARRCLMDSLPVVETAIASGLSGSGRLHDLFVQCEGVTPGEVARLGAELELRFAFVDTPFGRALAATSPRGLCHLRFVDGGDTAAWDDLRDEWPNATLREDRSSLARLADEIFETPKTDPGSSLSLWLKGTNFQIRVWLALLRLPEGSLTSYGQLAHAIGVANGARAVGNAVAMNPIAWLIPCHRVIRETGALGGYRWGIERKRILLGMEQARLSP